MKILEDVHNELNPKIFNQEFMKDEVREDLLRIVEEFISQLDDKLSFKILDIRLVGSNAAFNYTEHSDLDIHIVVNMREVCRSNPECAQFLFNSEKQRFNLNYDITVKGIVAEIYVEDVRACTVSNGIYSILDNRWIKCPVRRSVVDDSELDNDSGYLSLKQDVEDLLSTNSTGSEIQDFIDRLYVLRKNSLEVEGEQGKGNLMFKKLRNEGLLDKLKDKYYKVRSQELTLEGLTTPF